MWRFISLLLVVFFVIPYIVRSVLRYLFGDNQQQNRSSKSKKSNTSSRTQKPPPKKKVISKNEGEYVDYEVVKD